MIFLSKIKVFKCARIVTLLLILIFLLVLIQNIRNLNSIEEDYQEKEKSYLQSATIFNLKKALFKILHKEAFIETGDKEESCQKKYLFEIKPVNADPQKVLKIEFKNCSQAYMFTSFHRIMEFLNVKSCILEPSILHSLLPNKYRELLAKRNFLLKHLTGSQYIMNFGVLGDDVKILQKKENILEFRKAGIQPYFVHAPLALWMKEGRGRLKTDKYTSHIFYMYYTWTIHVVVFYKRNNYLWHAALKQDKNFIFSPERNLLYADYDSAYENFNLNPILNKSSKLPSVYIPSRPQYFLFQIPSSRFLECNSTRAKYIKHPNITHNSLLEFNKKTLMAIRELKTLFQNLLMNFWIFSGTLLGWYRQCGVIPHTSDVDFGAWKSEIDDLDYIVNYFRENKKLVLKERMGLLEEALEFQLRYDGLRIDVFFLYKINNGTWASGHRPNKGYYFRYHYPSFTLCSAELLQEKVQVPCQAEAIILIEYGKKWMHPVTSWNYESSIHNRGPNIYWDKKIRPKAFLSYQT